MTTRRNFLKGGTAAVATGIVFCSCGLLQGAHAQAPSRQKLPVMVNGKRVKTIDVHAHCVIPVTEIVRGTPLARSGGGRGGALGPDRIALMDQQGVDVQALSINGYWWYAADRDLAAKIVLAQNEELAKWVATHPNRFVALASVALQHPDLAVEQLEEAVGKLGLRGVGIAGHVAGEVPSSPKYDPFWAKAEQLGVLVFVHPVGADNVLKDGVLRGRGDLGNIIGNPLETTVFFSRMIFDGTLDRFPRLKFCGAHAGGYLPSFRLGVDDRQGNHRPLAGDDLIDGFPLAVSVGADGRRVDLVVATVATELLSLFT